MIDLHSRQLKLIYALIVAGKSARFANDKIAALFHKEPKGCLPFTSIKCWIEQGALRERLEEVGTGNYTKLDKALREIVEANLDLATCTPQELEDLPGIGPKTSRFFILWTRPNEQYAALDVHILRWMREQGYDAPRGTPQSPALYAQLERAFLAEAHKRGMTPRELDLLIWEAGATAPNKVKK